MENKKMEEANNEEYGSAMGEAFSEMTDEEKQNLKKAQQQSIEN